MARGLLFSLLLLAGTLRAQTSAKYYNVDAIYYRGEDLYAKEMYGSAREVFHEYALKSTNRNAPLHIKARYYEAVSALELFNNDAVRLLKTFLEDYPETIYRKTIYFKLGNYYFQKKEYPETIVWLSKLAKPDVEEEKRPEFFFKLGYSYYQEGNMKAARDAFVEVKDTQSPYASPATYYFAHISYQEKAYQTALEHFKKLLDDGKFKEIVPYYIAQIYYLQGRYEDLVEFAPNFVDSVQAKNIPEMNHLVGDAYYKIGRYDESIPYLLNYAQKTQTGREDAYQLGYAYLKTDDFSKAIKQFDKVSVTKDALGQLALYHIGECYLAQENYAAARSAFEAASSLQFDDKIAEDALYRSAILSYKLDVNPYDEAIEAFELFLARYPNSPKRNDVFSYLVNVYSTTKQYDKALNAIEAVKDKDIRLKSAYQLIAYNKGTSEYTQSRYDAAISTFQLVHKYPVENKLTAQADYWTADALYHQKKYADALSAYRLFLANEGSSFPDLRSDAYYNMGYAYFNSSDMEKAAETFRIYTQESVTDAKKKADAYMRIADAYYLLSGKDKTKVAPAIEFYQKALDAQQGGEDRALFYQSKCYGFNDMREQQMACLTNIINNYTKSPYIIQSIFEVAVINRNENKDNEAIRYFKQIIQDYPENAMAQEAVYELGVCYLKIKDYANAESYLNKALLEYGDNKDMCRKASQKMLELYQKSQHMEKISQLASTYPCAGITTDLQDSISFNVAFDLYLDSNYQAAIPQFENYLTKYPNGLLRYSAFSYLGNAYYETGNTEKAYANYLLVLEGSNKADYETAQARTATYEYNQKEYAKALVHYQELSNTASYPARIYVAYLGMMRCQYLLENWANALEESEKVIGNALASKTELLEAYYTKGMSLRKLNRWDESLPSLNYVCDNSTSAMGAEASYTLAEISYLKNDYQGAEDQIRKLLKRKPAYDYWVAKGLILQSRNCIAKNDLFQAEYTLNSILQNYKVQDDGIVAETQQLMSEVQQLKNEPQPEVDSTQTIIDINGTPETAKP